jgi:hypothetical protein
MTDATHSEFDCADLVLAMLDWLDRRPESAAAIDDGLELLADERRRLLVDVMRTYGEELTLPDAAEEVAVREHGCQVTELSAELVANVYISLYHDHMPRLVEAGLLDYDQERDLVIPVEAR